MVNFVWCFTTDHLNHDLIVTQILMNPPFIVHESGGGEMAALAEKLLSLNILEPCEPIRGFFTCKKVLILIPAPSELSANHLRCTGKFW